MSSLSGNTFLKNRWFRLSVVISILYSMNPLLQWATIQSFFFWIVVAKLPIRKKWKILLTFLLWCHILESFVISVSSFDIYASIAQPLLFTIISLPLIILDLKLFSVIHNLDKDGNLIDKNNQTGMMESKTLIFKIIGWLIYVSSVVYILITYWLIDYTLANICLALVMVIPITLLAILFFFILPIDL